MSDKTRRRRSSHSPSSASQAETPSKLTVQNCHFDGPSDLKGTGPGIRGTYTLSRGPNLRPIQFEGDLIAEAGRDVIDQNGPKNERGRISHRAAIYRTRKGTIVTEFSSVDHTGRRIGKADVFGSVDEACEWFRPGPLATELLKKIGLRGAQTIE